MFTAPIRTALLKFFKVIMLLLKSFLDFDYDILWCIIFFNEVYNLSLQEKVLLDGGLRVLFYFKWWMLLAYLL